MGKRKRLTYIEILLILAIIAILVVWLFPRFLKMLDSNSAEVGTFRPPVGTSYLERYCLSSDQISVLLASVEKTSRKALILREFKSIVKILIVNSIYNSIYRNVTKAPRHPSSPLNTNPKLS
jgi:hypothetical protein